MMTPEEEERFVRAFLQRDRRGRWLTLLPSPSGRKRLLDKINHSYEFEPDFGEEFLHPTTAADVVARLRKEGAGRTVGLISADRGLDGLTLPLKEAVERVFNCGFGTYVVCDPDRLAYFESEDRDSHWLLKRTQARTDRS